MSSSATVGVVDALLSDFFFSKLVCFCGFFSSSLTPFFISYSFRFDGCMMFALKGKTSSLSPAIWPIFLLDWFGLFLVVLILLWFVSPPVGSVPAS